MKKNILQLLLIMALYMTVCACGNKGDLYMPDKKKDQEKTISMP